MGKRRRMINIEIKDTELDRIFLEWYNNQLVNKGRSIKIAIYEIIKTHGNMDLASKIIK